MRVKGKEGSGVLLDGLTHIQAHLHAVPGVVRQRLRQTRHTVITVTKNLDSHALVFLKEKAKWNKLKCIDQQLVHHTPLIIVITTVNIYSSLPEAYPSNQKSYTHMHNTLPLIPHVG